MHAFVTGAAGFIGSTLVDRLLALGHTVTGFDNFSTGFDRFLTGARSSSRFTLVKGDTLDPVHLSAAIRGADTVFHFAANADVRFGTVHPERDLQQNTIATFNVLEAMRINGLRRVVFASTGSVYGEPEVFPTPETAPFPVQTSLYGASKLAGEGLVQAYCAGFGFEGFIFRFVSILGERYSHGHVADFCRSLLLEPRELQVLGDGHQRKSYLYVQDCIDAVLTVVQQVQGNVHVFNVGTDESCEVNDSIDWIATRLNLRPVRTYTGGSRGWVGDSPFIFLDTSRIRALGWRPTLSIRDGVIRTVDYLVENRWILERR